MTKYHHLSHAQRYQIEPLHHSDCAPGAIALQLCRHIDTIKRELLRGCYGIQRYCADYAQHSSAVHKTACRNARRITQAVWSEVVDYLALDLSPEQTAQRLFAESGVSISHESIYLYIYAHPEQAKAKLRCSRKRRRRRTTPSSAQKNQRGAIQNRVSIDQRPSLVEDRSRVGDWEGDTVVGRKHLGGLVTMVERKTRYTLACALPRRCAGPTSQAIIDMLKPHATRCLTITLDNSSEFALHQEFGAALGADIYFAKPHSHWQRGLNENTNGLLGQHFPKGSCLVSITAQQVQHAVDRLNHRPRKCLGWRTLHEVYFDLPMSKLTL
jgi:IS30 family transposase